MEVSNLDLVISNLIFMCNNKTYKHIFPLEQWYLYLRFCLDFLFCTKLYIMNTHRSISCFLTEHRVPYYKFCIIHVSVFLLKNIRLSQIFHCKIRAAKNTFRYCVLREIFIVYFYFFIFFHSIFLKRHSFQNEGLHILHC